MPFDVTFTPGYTFDTDNGEPITLSKLNQLGLPSIGMSYTFSSDDFGSNSVERSVLKAQAEMYGVDSGAADAHVVDTSPNAFASLVDGVRIMYRANAANTSTVTLALDNLTAKAIKNVDGSDLVGGDIKAGQLVGVQFSQTADCFYLFTPTARVVEVNDGTASQDIVEWDGSKWIRHATRLKKFTHDFGLVSALTNLGSQAHGLAVVPDNVSWRLKCTDAGGDAGYAENDEVDVNSTYLANASCMSVWANATNIGYAWNQNAILLYPKGGGVGTSLTATKWNLIATAIVLDLT